jgi:hypothetical protein
MRKRAIGILAALALIVPVGPATAGPKSPNLAKCSGKQRRPANPYGSILPTVDPVSGTSTPAGQVPSQESDRRGVEVFPDKTPAEPKPARPDGKPERQVPPISSLPPSTSHQSC